MLVTNKPTCIIQSKAKQTKKEGRRLKIRVPKYIIYSYIILLHCKGVLEKEYGSFHVVLFQIHWTVHEPIILSVQNDLTKLLQK